MSSPPGSLIARLESATGPSLILDADIAIAAGGYTERHGDWVAKGEHDAVVLPPAYTASIDAAMTLVPADLFWTIGKGRLRPEEPFYGARLHRPVATLDLVAEAEHDCLAVALCIAALRARVATDAR